MSQRQADLSFALEQFDSILVVAPAAAQDFDGHDAPRLRIVGTVDSAKAARGDLVKDAIAADDQAVGVAFDKFLRLKGGQVAFAFERKHERQGLAAALADLVPTFLKLLFCKQPQFQS